MSACLKDETATKGTPEKPSRAQARARRRRAPSAQNADRLTAVNKRVGDGLSKGGVERIGRFRNDTTHPSARGDAGANCRSRHHAFCD
jgi:hypothetical protein